MSCTLRVFLVIFFRLLELFSPFDRFPLFDNCALLFIDPLFLCFLYFSWVGFRDDPLQPLWPFSGHTGPTPGDDTNTSQCTTIRRNFGIFIHKKWVFEGKVFEGNCLLVYFRVPTNSVIIKIIFFLSSFPTFLLLRLVRK